MVSRMVSAVAKCRHHGRGIDRSNHGVRRQGPVIVGRQRGGPDAHCRDELDAGARSRGRRRPRRAADRLDRAARASEPVGRHDPVGARRHRGGRAVADSGVSGDRLRADAELRRVSRHGHAAHGHAVRSGDRRARRHREIGLPAHPDRERAWRKYPDPRRGARMARPSSRLPGEVAQLVECAEDLGQGDGDRSGRLARIVAGEFSLDPAARCHAAGGAASR